MHSEQPATPSRIRFFAALILMVTGCPLLAAGAPESPSVVPELWGRAAAIAAASRWMVPGRAVIEETTTENKKTTHSRVTAELRQNRNNEPAIHVREVSIDGEDRTREKSDEIATGLQPMVDSLFEQDHPLAQRGAHPTLAGESMIAGAPCRGFTTSTESDGIALELVTWIDIEKGFARRIDFHALGLPLEKDGATIRSLSGHTDYTIDSEGRWVVVAHQTRSTVEASFFLAKVNFSSDQKIRCDQHWEYRGAKRTGGR